MKRILLGRKERRRIFRRRVIIDILYNKPLLSIRKYMLYLFNIYKYQVRYKYSRHKNSLSTKLNEFISFYLIVHIADLLQQ